MQKRSFKFYRQNEADVMKSLGLKPTKNSGSGWIEKEDGQNDYLICQLKSTDAQSIKVNQKDIRVLEKNANVSHKIPVFAIQFLNTGEVWLMAKPLDFAEVADYIKTGKCEISEQELNFDDVEDVKPKTVKKKIKSSENARQAFHNERQEKFKKEKKAW
jgi:Holliday junction resolvase